MYSYRAGGKAMMKKLKLEKHMIRPFIYMTFTRFILSLTAALLIEHFIQDPLRDISDFAFVFFGIFFAVLAWIAYLRLDGVKLPKIMMKRVNPSKKPAIRYGDMIDHIDEEIVNFDDLEDNEKDVCILLADLICMALFFILSVV